MPLSIPSKNLTLWPKSRWIMNYDETQLRGEYVFLKRCVENNGGKVVLYDPDDIKDLEPSQILDWLVNQKIISL